MQGDICEWCRDRRAELDEAQLNLAALKTLSDEADLLRARVAELEPLQVFPGCTYCAFVMPGCSTSLEVLMCTQPAAGARRGTGAPPGAPWLHITLECVLPDCSA